MISAGMGAGLKVLVETRAMPTLAARHVGSLSASMVERAKRTFARPECVRRHAARVGMALIDPCAADMFFHYLVGFFP